MDLAEKEVLGLCEGDILYMMILYFVSNGDYFGLLVLVE